MMFSGRGAQASCMVISGQPSIRAAAMLLTVVWLLAGCSTISAMNPVNWWHREQGGKIAEQRPAPPGTDAPYPNISTVPAKPELPDAEALKKLTASLVADRANAQHAAQSAPLADPSSPRASPGLFGVGTAPPPPSSATSPAAASGSPRTPVASASMPAVTAPPPSVADSSSASPSSASLAGPSAAPRKAVQSAPLEAPPAATTSAPGPLPLAASSAGSTQPVLPAGPPTRPNAAGPPPSVPAMPAPMPAPTAGPSATIVFLEHASDLAQPAAEEVKAFAGKRGNSTIAIIGYGDAVSSDADAQSAALTLGLSRAQSIVEALKTAGVPGNAIRVGAEASGRGASLRLLQ